MKTLFLFLITSLPFHGFGQMLFGTAGGSISNPQHQFDFSIGEAVTSEISTSESLVHIGFQQPYYDFFTAVTKPIASNFQVFPNPFSRCFRFETGSEIDHYSLFDASGKSVFQSQVSGQYFEYAVAGLPHGLYQLRVWLKNGQTIGAKLVHE